MFELAQGNRTDDVCISSTRLCRVTLTRHTLALTNFVKTAFWCEYARSSLCCFYTTSQATKVCCIRMSSTASDWHLLASGACFTRSSRHRGFHTKLPRNDCTGASDQNNSQHC